MQAISEYISQLLFYHECVILPNFGGLVGNYKPAYVQTIQHKFHPPSKQITFNKNLINNDGLLAHYIAKKENCSYNEALKEIDAFVLTIKTKLKTTKAFTLGEIGMFVTDNENRIHFEPSLNENYLLSSYGLTTFRANPIKRETYEERISEQIKISSQQKTSIKKWVAAAAILIPLGFLTLWLPIHYDLSKEINYAKLNPFVTVSEKAVYTQRKAFTSFNEDDDLMLLENQLKNDTTQSKYLPFSWIKNEPPITIALNKTEIAKADTTSVVLKKHFRYHIVAGCFSEKKNAKRMVNQLKEKGFEAWIIGQRKGLWTVSYNSFTSRKEAVDALALAKLDNQKAWMLEM